MAKKESTLSVLDKETISKAMKKHKSHDWPAVFVGAQYYNNSQFAKTQRISNDNLTKQLNSSLLSELQKLGNIGSRVNGHSVGYCAEVHAANKILQLQPKPKNVKQIRFSQAIRPRTMQIIKYCNNCLCTFNLKN